MTYEYECVKGHKFEEQAPISAPPRKRCKVCRCKCERKINATGFILKGGGWFKDGYTSKKP